MADWWEDLFTGLGSFLNLLSAREESVSVAVAETTLLKLECYFGVLCTIVNILTENHVCVVACVFPGFVFKYFYCFNVFINTLMFITTFSFNAHLQKH